MPAMLASPFLPAVAMPAGGGLPVMVLPGYLTADLATIRLRRSLHAAGYWAHGWQMGTNWGVRVDLLDRLVARVTDIANHHGRSVALVGWSLGGVFAREAAKLVPEHIAVVVSLGSPFSGSLRANNAWRLYEFLNDHPVDRPPLEVELSVKPPVPTYALWSRRDGIVAPAAAAGREGERDAAFEVDCRHLAFPRARAGIEAIGEVLKQFT